jgi:hypothetical protein
MNAMSIWVIKDGQREGPYDEDDVRELIYEGTYTDKDPAIREGQYDWSTLGTVLERAPEETPPINEAGTDLDLPDAEDEVEAAQTPPLFVEGPIAQEPAEPVPAASLTPATGMRVTISDLDVSFGSMVVFLLKWMAACFVVLLIAGVVLLILWLLIAAMAAAIFR